MSTGVMAIGCFVMAPFFLIISLILTSIFFYTYKIIYLNQYSKTNLRQFWNPACTILAKFWSKFGKIVHGYEIDGIDRIPTNRPTILVLYHPQGPLDAFFIISTIFLQLKRKLIAIVERMNFKIPGFKTYLEALEQTAGTVESCVSMLDKGEILLIYPGGMKEGLTSSGYELKWKKNAGFAKVAQQAKPVIPVFTENTREVTKFLPLGFGIRFPICWFPVKLKTYVGKPIEYDEHRSVEELVSIVKLSLEELIKKHQRQPPSIIYALLQRFK